MPAEPLPTSVECIERGAASYPHALTMYLQESAPPAIHTRGNSSLLALSPIAIYCSVRCPGDLILRTYDLAVALRDAGLAVIGGFHSPMEKECLALLLRGTQPVIVCPARSIENMQLPTEWRAAVEGGRLLLASSFGATTRRTSKDTARDRNRFVAALAGPVVVAHAEPGSGTEALCQELISWGKPVFAFDSPYNRNILTLGVQPIDPGSVAALFDQFGSTSRDNRP